MGGNVIRCTITEAPEERCMPEKLFARDLIFSHLFPYFPINTATNRVSIKLDVENYLLWHDQFMQILICNDMLWFVDGTISAPPATIINESYKSLKTRSNSASATSSLALLPLVVTLQLALDYNTTTSNIGSSSVTANSSLVFDFTSVVSTW
ncbi:hypothetical protein L1049_021383 [Liquidambar formosana]|uniref:Retrotransposon Copia-like N-terminal domain-containing protein n=1 Tax=Liquidambar formosana TaxID=63359 RepID=A0AAP0N673_LIQFO